MLYSVSRRQVLFTSRSDLTAREEPGAGHGVRRVRGHPSQDAHGPVPSQRSEVLGLRVHVKDWLHGDTTGRRPTVNPREGQLFDDLSAEAG